MTTATAIGVLPRRFELFDQMLRVFPPGHLADIGAGPGMFSFRAAQAGWKVTAIDARSDRFPAHKSGIEWVTGDVRKVPLGGYDVIACLGLFYHLTPEDQVSLLKRCAGTPIILDTHVDSGESTHPLSERVKVGRYHGSWYREPGETTSSLGNEQSFWPTPDSLYQMLRDCGYPVVLAAQPWVKPDRTFFLALPEGYDLGRAPWTPIPARDEVEVLARTVWRRGRRLAGRVKRRTTRLARSMRPAG
ncbi:MAG TPA: class I SAM-dependent methyltransferase [Actinomycetales bacterium]|nr:class I SAM-dependent methyltransferase [Actinomycetales bacterium]